MKLGWSLPVQVKSRATVPDFNCNGMRRAPTGAEVCDVLQLFVLARFLGLHHYLFQDGGEDPSGKERDKKLARTRRVVVAFLSWCDGCLAICLSL